MSAILEAAPLHAVVVDDDSIFGRRLANGLSEFGLDAVAFGRIEEALAAVARRLPDVVLLSPFLPDGSGLQLIEALRGDEQAYSTAIIALAPNAEGPPKLIANGCDAVLVKPCSAQQVIDRIDQLFGTRPVVVG